MTFQKELRAVKRNYCRTEQDTACSGSSRRSTHFFDEGGQDLIEYALLSALLAVGFVLMLQALANGVIPFFDAVIAALQAV